MKLVVVVIMLIVVLPLIAGIHLVVNPTDVHRKGKERHTKTGHIDAQLIARELKDGRLERICLPDMELEQLRSLFRRRNDLVKNYRTIKNLIKSQFSKLVR
jgi:transposase